MAPGEPEKVWKLAFPHKSAQFPYLGFGFYTIRVASFTFSGSPGALRPPKYAEFHPGLDFEGPGGLDKSQKAQQMQKKRNLEKSKTFFQFYTISAFSYDNFHTNPRCRPAIMIPILIQPYPRTKDWTTRLSCKQVVHLHGGSQRSNGFYF